MTNQRLSTAAMAAVLTASAVNHFRNPGNRNSTDGA